LGDFSVVFLSEEVRGHNFTSNKNRALRDERQMGYLEGAFTGVF
jgi:hypothetical protein